MIKKADLTNGSVSTRCWNHSKISNLKKIKIGFKGVDRKKSIGGGGAKYEPSANFFGCLPPPLEATREGAKFKL